MQSAEVVGDGNGDIRRYPEHGLDPRRPIERAAADIEVPQAHLGGLGREPQLLLAFTERPRGGSLIRHVDARADVAHECPAGEARHPGGVQHAPSTVAAPAAIFRAIRLMTVECDVVDRNAVIDVLGMNAIHPTDAYVLLHRTSGKLEPRFVEPD